MLNLKTKLATGLATAGIMAATFAPAAFATDVEVVNNGAWSDNTVIVKNSNVVAVEQTNETNAVTEINAVANTGGNTANGNTGSDVTINTGKAVNNVSVSVQGGNNRATLPEGCGCPDDDTVSVRRNGAKSDNYVKIKNEDVTAVGQGSATGALTGVNTKANTGKNQAKWNTGENSSVTIWTKKSKNTVSVEVAGGNNVLN